MDCALLKGRSLRNLRARVIDCFAQEQFILGLFDGMKFVDIDKSLMPTIPLEPLVFQAFFLCQPFLVRQVRQTKHGMQPIDAKMLQAIMDPLRPPVVRSPHRIFFEAGANQIRILSGEIGQIVIE